MNLESIVVYLLPLAVIFGFYSVRRRIRGKGARRTWDAAVRDGLTEPASLHPIVDPLKCMGCGVCIPACPEAKEQVLGLVGGKAALVNPTHCIGHGACKEACPTDAITLVLGTEKRGVDIPSVGKDFQTNLPGVFVVGELGGMGLIRNAITQGCQVMEGVEKLAKDNASDCDYDVAIVGAGPAGFAASLAAKAAGLRYVTIEQETLGGTVAHYPRGKLVMTRPVELPLYGSIKLRETSKEELLGLWTDVAKKTGIEIRYSEQVKGIRRTTGFFSVHTDKASYTTETVVLAIGRRGTPRKLDVPGEELPKVVYRLIDAEQYAGNKVLVVGGGDSALEAATSIAEQPGTSVTLSYRGEAFSRAKPANRERVACQAERHGLEVLLESVVREIAKDRVVLERRGEKLIRPNDAIIVCAGGVLPTGFLTEVGISIETKRGTAIQ